MTADAAVENPHAGQGSVLLDIGDDIGAVVVSMPAAMDGAEVEIRPVGADQPEHRHAHDHAHDHAHGHDHAHDHGAADSPWPHVAVVGRPTPSGVVHSLVFGAVEAGRYELYVRPDGPVELTVDVSGGAVTEASWPR